MAKENPSCPQCQTELEDDFGIVDCNSCGAVCSVDLDGGVTLQGEVGDAEEELELEAQVEESAEEDVSVLEEQLEEIEEEVYSAVATPMGAAGFLKDLEVFTEESQSESLDHVYYDLHVQGLESRELRALFTEHLFDGRLDLSEEYLSSLIGEKSFCVVPQLSFLRLQVAYKRILPLGLELSWNLSEIQQPVVHEVEEHLGAEEYAEDEY